MIGLLRIPRFRIVYPLRGLAAWVGVRLLAAAAKLITMNLAQSVLVVAVVALAVWLDARRRREDLFLANLGIPAWAIAVGALPFPILLEWWLP